MFLSGDITTAFKTVDGALRLDPTNETLKKQMDKIKPQFEKQEKHRGIYIHVFIYGYMNMYRYNKNRFDEILRDIMHVYNLHLYIYIIYV
jgi:hypothetical protein